MIFFMISIQVMGILSVDFIFELQEHTLKPRASVELLGGLPALPPEAFSALDHYHPSR